MLKHWRHRMTKCFDYRVFTKGVLGRMLAYCKDPQKNVDEYIRKQHFSDAIDIVYMYGSLRLSSKNGDVYNAFMHAHKKIYPDISAPFDVAIIIEENIKLIAFYPETVNDCTGMQFVRFLRCVHDEISSSLRIELRRVV